jgi:hypothetical protein
LRNKHTHTHTHRSQLGASRDRLLEGLQKLHDTEVMVTSMKADLDRLQPELEAKAAATAELLVKVCAGVWRAGANELPVHVCSLRGEDWPPTVDCCVHRGLLTPPDAGQR